MPYAHPTAHAFLQIYRKHLVQGKCTKRTCIHTGATGSAVRLNHFSNIPGRSQRRDAVFHHRLNTGTAAFAAVTDCVEAVQQNILKPGRMDMSPFMLLSQEFQGLRLGKTPAALGVVLQDEIGKGLADGHAHLDRLAGVRASVSTSAFENSDIRRPLKNQVPGHGIRNDLLQVT